MSEDEDRPKPKRLHVIGESLETLSVGEFDERIALLRQEIERLEAGKKQKAAALDQAGSVFRSAS